MKEKRLVIEYPDCLLNYEEMEELIKEALTTHAKFGHIEGELDETKERVAIVLSKNIKAYPDKSKYNESKIDSAWRLMSRFEKLVETKLSSDKASLDLLKEVSLETIKGFENWKCTPLWGVSSRLVDMGDGNYRIKHDKDIDSSG